jgi:hypothetical protein
MRISKMCVRYFRCRERPRDRPASSGHAMADQGVAGAARDSVGPRHDLSHDRASRSVQREGVARGGNGGRAQSDFLADPLPSRAGQRRRVARLSLGADAQARDAGVRSGARSVRKAEDVCHRVEAGLLPLAPARRGDGALRENRAIFGNMCKDDSFARTCQNHFVFADTVPPRNEANPMAPSLRAPVIPSRPAQSVVLQGDVTAFRRRAPQQQCGPGRRIHLVAVMHLDNLDIESRKRLRGLSSRAPPGA